MKRVLSILGFSMVCNLPVGAFAVPLFNSDRVVTLQSVETEVALRAQQLQNHRGFHGFEMKSLNTEQVRFESIEQVARDFKVLDLNLLGNRNLKARMKSVTAQPGNLISWVGRVEGDLHSVAVFTERNQHLAGEVYAFGKTYSIKPMGEGIVAVRELSPELAESPGDDQFILDSKIGSSVETSLSQTVEAMAADDDDEDGSVIDIYVFYNPAADAGSSDIEVEIANDIAFTNRALDASCTYTSLRLLGTQLLNFVESGDAEDDLNSLVDRHDGHVDNVHDIRLAQGADLVQVWIENPSAAPEDLGIATVCGIAVTSIPEPGPNSGFSIKVRPCSAHTTAHEIGHNFTVMHDRYTCKDYKLQANYDFETGWGYVNLNDKVRDIMSYDIECLAHGMTCARLPYYSNPRLFVNGAPFGLPSQADAATQILRNKKHLARLRPHVTEPTAPDFNACAETRANALKLDKCFIATAAFGSFLDPKVVRFRQFRDGFLAESDWGRRLIEVYYDLSPSMATFIEQHDWLKPPVRGLLAVTLFLIEFPVFALIAVIALIVAVIVWVLKGTRVRSTVVGLIALVLLTPGLADASYNNPTGFSGGNEVNPAALPQVGTSLRGVSLDLANSSRVYSTSKRDIESSEMSLGTQLGFRWLGPRISFAFLFDPGSVENSKRKMLDGGYDKWETTWQHYRLYSSMAVLPGLVFGAGARFERGVLPRESTSDFHGVEDTEAITDSLLYSAGGRWIVSPGISLAGLVEWGETVSSDTVAGQTARGVFSVGYFGGGADVSAAAPGTVVTMSEGGGLLRKADLSYIVVPESVAYDGSPFGNTWNHGKSGFNFQFELGHRFMTGPIQSALFGYEYESLTWKGFDGEGDGADENQQVIRAGVGLLQELLQVRVSWHSRTLAFSGTDETSSALQFGATYQF